MVAIAYAMAYVLRFDPSIPHRYQVLLAESIGFVVVGKVAIFALFRLYHRLWRFSALTLAGCVPWVLMLTILGQQAGDRWKSWRHSLEYVDYAVAAAIVIGIVYLIVRRRRERSRNTATETA